MTEEIHEVLNLSRFTDRELSKLDYPAEEMQTYAKKWGKHFRQFLDGLYVNGITFKVFNEDMIYFGGNSGKHQEHFKQQGGIYSLPFKDKCICGIDIVEQCYTVFKDDIHCLVKKGLTIGNECVKHYIDLQHRKKHCFKCANEHYNLKSSYCSECRKRCSSCEQIKQNVTENGVCILCKNNEKREQDAYLKRCKCGKKCGKYRQCWNCYNSV